MMTSIKEDEGCFIANKYRKPQRPEAYLQLVCKFFLPSFPQRYPLLGQCNCNLVTPLSFLKILWTACSPLGTSFPLTGLSVLLNQDTPQTNWDGDGRGRCGDWGRVFFISVHHGPRMSLLPWLCANVSTGRKERVTCLSVSPFLSQAPSLAYFEKKCHW